jgi:hypothetical protein
LAVALKSLRGVEPYEVMQALGARRRWPRRAEGPYGHVAMTIWARTDAGRPLIVAVRQLSGWDWQIVGARDLRPDELRGVERWESR